MGGINVHSELCRFDYYEKRPKYFVFSDAFLLFKGSAVKRTITNLKRYQSNTCAHLKQLFPSAKVLVITRSPETSIPSEYSEHIKNGGTLTFDELMSNAEAIEHFIGYYNYNFAINLYCNNFGKENVFVLPMEFLEEEPEQFIKTIEDKLGLSHHDFKYHKRNSSLPAYKLDALRKISRFVHSTTKLLGKKGEIIFGMYIMYMGKESYKNNKFSFLISLLSLFSKKNSEKIIAPEKLVNDIKANASVLKGYPCFENYIHKYCTE